MHRIVPAFLALPVVAAACQSTGIEQAENTAQSLHALQLSLAAAPARVDAAADALLAIDRAGDRKAAFAAFGSALDELVVDRERVQALREAVEADEADYTGAWGERLDAIHDADLRKRAATRRDAVVEQFGDLLADVDRAQQQFGPWLQTALDVRAYLEDELNAGGVASVRDRIQGLDRDSASVRAQLDKVVHQLGEMEQSIVDVQPSATATAAR